MHDAVDLGRLVHGAALTGRIDEDLAGEADQRIPLGGRDRILQLGALAQSLEGELGRHLAVEVGGVGAVLAGIGEEAGPVQLSRGEEFEQEVMVALGLARVTEDEGGPEGGVGLGGPDVADAPQKALAVTPATHAGEQRTRHVLQREVEVRHARGEHGLNQLISQPGGVEVEQTGAIDAGRHGAGECSNGRRTVGDAGTPTRARAIPAVRSQVLSDEDDLAQGRRAVGGGAQGVDLGQHLLRRTGALLAPERRDGAEAADAIAALGDLDVRPGAAGGGARQLQEVEPIRGRRRSGGAAAGRERDGDGRCWG